MKIVYEAVQKTDRLPTFFSVNNKLKKELNYRNWHEDIEIMFSFGGTGGMYYDDEFISLKKNEFCLVNSNVIHGMKGEGEGIEYCLFMLPVGFCKLNGLDIGDFIYEKRFFDAKAKEKLQMLKKCFNAEKDALYTARFNAALMDFAVYISENHARPRAVREKNSEKNINYAIGFIKANYNRKLTLDEICAQSGFSKYYFLREFKKITGYTVIEYVNLLRCEMVCRLLKEGLSVNEAFNEMCFDSFSYFSKVFSKHIGMPPSEYKRKYSSYPIEQ